MEPKRITAGVYRIAKNGILFRKHGRALRMTRHNRSGGNATVKCATWVICKTDRSDEDLLEFFEITHWHTTPGEFLGEYETKREALEAAVLAQASVGHD
jgi:hypothetical protein